MDTEEQTQSLLGPSREELAAVKVFPLINQLKRDVVVSRSQRVYFNASSYNIDA